MMSAGRCEFLHLHLDYIVLLPISLVSVCVFYVSLSVCVSACLSVSACLCIYVSMYLYLSIFVSVSTYLYNSGSVYQRILFVCRLTDYQAVTEERREKEREGEGREGGKEGGSV